MINKLIILFVFIGSSLFAQNSVIVNSISENKIAANNKKTVGKSHLKMAHPYDYYFDNKIKEYEERMVANAKKYKKMKKEMEKPQYSDPSYFGHKRKPKKHKPGKRKFCKECEIVH
jgi:hypothetical protein